MTPSIWFWVNHSEDPARKIRETARVITPPESWFSKIFPFERVLQKRCNCYPFNQRFFPSLKVSLQNAGLALCWCYPDLLCWYSIQPSLPWSLPLFEHSQTLMFLVADEGDPKMGKTSKLGCSGTLPPGKAPLFTTQALQYNLCELKFHVNEGNEGNEGKRLPNFFLNVWLKTCNSSQGSEIKD